MTMLLSRADVERLLTPEACIAAVEDAFRRLAEGKVPSPGILGMHAGDGSFHVKASFLTLDRPYFAAKLNANFPQNGKRHGLPTIQGVVILCDAANGAPLAVMDSMAITALRTAAATAVAAMHLAPEHCDAALICGCGGQAATQLRALLRVRRPARVYAYDQDLEKARQFATSQEAELAIEVSAVPDLGEAVAASRIIVTCTTAQRYFITRDMVKPGTFVAAVGADSEKKQEIEPALMASATVVTDLTDQACAIGDLHHAIAAGAMSREQVHAELGEVVAGKRRGRMNATEIVVFDSTGTGLQDVAAAIAAYRKAVDTQVGGFVFGDQGQLNTQGLATFMPRHNR
ncbi:MAG TPA: ornithine cyclodeaminase family protein [Burkholderiales bacterium]|jgi:ornithine cyclodeaminase/alanine dehydrogenase-like protein (mu-crystallin family)|nr:ornithine cyclodeaminase family protein [Burkholderiales bacterium]